MLHALIRGMDNERIRWRLFKMENMDLSRARRMCQYIEAMANDLQSLVANRAEVSKDVAGNGNSSGEEEWTKGKTGG